MQKLDDFAEVENGLLMLFTYIIFGMIMLPPVFEHKKPASFYLEAGYMSSLITEE